MAANFEWRTKDENIPVKAIYHNPQNGRTTVQFYTQDGAEDAEMKMLGFDRRSAIDGQVHVMSRTINPQLLAGYLLEQGLINQVCFDELQKDLRDYRNEREGGAGRG